MKYLATLMMIVLFSSEMQAQNNYSNLWEKVHEYELEELPKSALKEVEKIYNLAKSQNNAPQITKAVIYKSKFALTLEENAQLKIINQLKSEIKVAKSPAKQVLQNILAKWYWQYYKKNRYRFYNRTKTNKKVDANDFRTWDLNTLYQEVHQQYQASLENKSVLQNTDIKSFYDILQTEANSRLFRPTLYDFLAQNALTFYGQNELNITKPAYKFELDNPQYLSDAKDFVNLNIETKDTLSLQFNSLKIFQDLIKLHQDKNNALALAQVNEQRITFVNNKTALKDKETLYENALKNALESTKGEEASVIYTNALANFYIQLGHQYNVKENPKHQFKKVEALNLLENAIKAFPNSFLTQNSAYFVSTIKKPEVSLTSEAIIPTQQESLLLVNYKNVPRLYFNAYRIDAKQEAKFESIYNTQKKIDFINKLESVQTWNNSLKTESDYQQHSTEVIVPALANGNYLIVASTSQDLSSENMFATSFMQATNLLMIQTHTPEETIYQVVNRMTGKPIEGVKVNFKNDAKRRGRYDKKINKNFTTDKNGMITVNVNNYYNNVVATLKHKDETAVFKYYYLNERHNYRNDFDIDHEIFIFTDRSIYRPGQTVYFKGIALAKGKNQTEVITNEAFEVTLYDVNYEEVKKLTLKTNEFGSFASEFILPNTGLTGGFEIEVESVNGEANGGASFNVEEYKRPKFETEFKPITKTYKIDDDVKVTGKAIAFAGSNITDAKVVYRVHREVNYPRWYYWYRSSYPSSEAQEITNGETKTNAQGEFEIDFKALADKSVGKESMPTFTYKIEADITDINGETRSASTTVKVGYHSLVVNVTIDDQLDKKSKENSFIIASENLNGEPIDSKVEVKIYKLQAPKHALRNRLWSAPDYQEIPKKTFKKLFPFEAYTNEHEDKNWEKGTLVFDKTIDTKKDGTVDLKRMKKWSSGKYLIVATTKDETGLEVKDEQRFSVFGKDDKTVADNALFTINTDKNSYQPNETVVLTLGSASKNMTVTLFVEKNQEIVKTYKVHLDDELKTIKIPVKKEDVGGFAIHYQYVNYNQFTSGTQKIVVPFKKKDLEIIAKTFRDKLQPNQDETWSFTIKGPEGDKIASEVLASMYDASLDMFKDHSWYLNAINYYYYRSRTNSNANNSIKRGYFSFNNNYRLPNYRHQKYDHYNWFGFHMYNRWQNNQYLSTLKMQRKNYDGILFGIVRDVQDVLPAVNIQIKGTQFGTVTNFDGQFNLKVKKGETIVISSVGYKTKEIKVENFNSLDITLEAGDSLDEVVVTAHGISRNKMYSAAPTAEHITEADEMEVSNSLSGKVAGVQVTNSNGAVGSSSRVVLRGASSLTGTNNPLYVVDGILVESSSSVKSIKPNDIASITVLKGPQAAALYGVRGKNGVILITTKKGQQAIENELASVKARKNLQETAFFFPQLQTDSKGNVSFSFKAPEALTRWNLNILAHGKNGETGKTQLQAVTQKDLMLLPNAPRFLRDGDTIVFATKISNLTNKKLEGFVALQLTDAVTGKDINAQLNNIAKNQNFTIDAKGNTNVNWQLVIPDNVQAVQYKVVAKAGNFSDGEQNALPVLSNRMLVTETLPMWIRSNQTKTFTLDKLKNNNSTSLKHHKLTLEMTSNPAWYAVQALPYLMEYPYECAEQTFSRYYANTLASHIANSNPRIQEVFNQWKNSDALISNLEKNQELKSLIIQETPWLRQAQSETEQKKRIALLFDFNHMSNNLQSALNKLKNMQRSDGAWSWFKGSRYPNRYITQHIATGFGHLMQLNVAIDDKAQKMATKAVKFLDDALIEDYEKLQEQARIIKEKAKTKALGEAKAKAFLKQNHTSHLQLQFLYMRSFFKGQKVGSKLQKVIDYYTAQSQEFWKDYNLYSKAMIALIHHRNDNSIFAKKILKSLKENSINTEELGMYWKANQPSYYWYQAPIETQALMIEAFSEIASEVQTVDALKVWLLKNKQTNRWKTTKATTEAVYALLLQGSEWLDVTEQVAVTIGGNVIEPTKLEDVKVEAGTGYYKTSWSSNEIQPSMATVKLDKKGDGIAWGGLYWQYFEDLDKITTFEETPLKLKKQLFLKSNSDTGKELSPITKDTKLQLGDLVTVRIELRCDRAMEFIHMKDTRAAGLEPVDVISQYKWQDGLGYYQSTKDASTNFFISRLPKGVFVFEYDLRVNNQGNFSNGITTIQSMYAPEFSSHSEGVRIDVE